MEDYKEKDIKEIYIISEGKKNEKINNKPRPEDYFDVLETEEERAERIYLYSEVKN